MKHLLASPLLAIADAPAAQVMDAALEQVESDLKKIVGELSKFAESRTMQPDELEVIEGVVKSACDGR